MSMSERRHSAGCHRTSGLHEVGAQATKNLGYLTSSAAELEARKARWSGQWNQRPIARLQRGASVDAFVAAFAKAVAAPQATRRVVIVTLSLSKGALATVFDLIGNGPPPPAVVHVLWLLSTFVDQCRNVGARAPVDGTVPHLTGDVVVGVVGTNQPAPESVDLRDDWLASLVVVDFRSLRCRHRVLLAGRPHLTTRTSA